MMDTTAIHIFINHDPEILDLIKETIPYIPGWVFHQNAYPTNPHWKNFKKKIGTYYRFGFKDKVFEWWGETTVGNHHVIPIRTLAAASKLLELIYLVETKKIEPETAVNFVKSNLPNITG